jgi:hypothetical protein
VASLDAAKAFDKLWRDGLFYKLIGKVDDLIWRSLYQYYLSSFIIVCVDNRRSGRLATSEGCKQGGILSPFLFNFYVDDLLSEINDLNIGALVGNFNTFILAYCDDVLLLSPNIMHINCAAYADEWKLVFNASKSAVFSLKAVGSDTFRMRGVGIPSLKGIMYLGLPIGDKVYIEDFFATNYLQLRRLYTRFGESVSE